MPRTQSKPPSGIKNIQRGQYLATQGSTNSYSTQTITVNQVDMNNCVLYANASRHAWGGVYAWQSTSYWSSSFNQPRIRLIDDTTIEIYYYTGGSAGPGGNGRKPTLSWELVEYY